MLDLCLFIGLALLIIFNLVYSYIIYKKVEKVKKGIREKIVKEEEKKLKEEAQKNFESEKERIEQELKLIINEGNAKKEKQELENKLAVEKANQKISALQIEIESSQKRRDDIIAHEKEMIDTQIESYRELKEQHLNSELNKKREEKITELSHYVATEHERLEKQIAEKREEATTIQRELEDYKARRARINEAIMREKELTEKENYYKINLSENDIEDLKLLKNLEINFHNREVLHKAAYDCYVKKPLLEMTKRVLGGKDVSGIYKITYIPTGESYIGKSTNVSKRWTEHAKSVFGVGSIASAIVHNRMARDGIWNFTWELLEEVPKPQLNEREKYWIDFYGTKELGMNERLG